MFSLHRIILSGLEQQEIDEEEGCEAEEYNAEDDIPDPDAPGQQNEEEQTIEELPDNMEGLEDQEVGAVPVLFLFFAFF